MKGKTASMDYEMLLSGKNGFALKRYWKVGKIRNIEKLWETLRWTERWNWYLSMRWNYVTCFKVIIKLTKESVDLKLPMKFPRDPPWEYFARCETEFINLSSYAIYQVSPQRWGGKTGYNICVKKCLKEFLQASKM